jgi:hypothetical protein
VERAQERGSRNQPPHPLCWPDRLSGPMHSRQQSRKADLMMERSFALPRILRVLAGFSEYPDSLNQRNNEVLDNSSYVINGLRPSTLDFVKELLIGSNQTLRTDSKTADHLESYRCKRAHLAAKVKFSGKFVPFASLVFLLESRCFRDLSEVRLRRSFLCPRRNSALS